QGGSCPKRLTGSPLPAPSSLPAPRSPLRAPVFNLLTARQLATMFGGCSVPEPLGRAGDMKQLVYAALGAGLLCVSTAHRLAATTNAQNPDARLQQALQQNPGLADVIRQRIQQSGLSPEQIRARLQASGYPPTLLDA